MVIKNKIRKEMELSDLLTIIGGVSISVIGYFLKATMDKIKEIGTIVYENKTKLEVIENDYLNKIDRLNDKIILLYTAIDKLTNKIEGLNEKISDNR